MSTSTTERRESMGLVAETLRRPIQEAVKDGVKEAVREAMQEQEQTRQGQSGRVSGSGEEGGGGPGKFAMLALLGAGVAAIMLWRRRSGGSGDGGGVAESIREKAKLGETGSSDTTEVDPSSTETGGGAVEATDQSDEAEDAAPEASTE